MILVDMSVWIDHFRQTDPLLFSLLDAGQVLAHPWSIGELALGNLRNRTETLRLLRRLPSAPVMPFADVLQMIDDYRLHGLGIGYVDAQLLAATRFTRDASVWTRDRRLLAAAQGIGIAYEPPVR